MKIALINRYVIALPTNKSDREKHGFFAVQTVLFPGMLKRDAPFKSDARFSEKYFFRKLKDDKNRQRRLLVQPSHTRNPIAWTGCYVAIIPIGQSVNCEFIGNYHCDTKSNPWPQKSENTMLHHE